MGHCRFSTAEKVALGHKSAHIRRGWLLGKTLKHSLLIGVQWTVLSTESLPRSSQNFSTWIYWIVHPKNTSQCHYYILLYLSWLLNFRSMSFELKKWIWTLLWMTPLPLVFSAGFIAWGGHISCWQKLTVSHKNWNLCKHGSFKEHYLIPSCDFCGNLFLP